MDDWLAGGRAKGSFLKQWTKDKRIALLSTTVVECVCIVCGGGANGGTRPSG